MQVTDDPVVDRRARALLGSLNRMPEVNAALPESEREVLALLADNELTYAEVSRVLAIDAAQVAELGGSGRLRIARALGLEFTASAVGGEHTSLGDLSASIDGEAALTSHARSCSECRSLLVAMRLADRMYRSWATVPMPDWVRTPSVTYGCDETDKR